MHRILFLHDQMLAWLLVLYMAETADLVSLLAALLYSEIQRIDRINILSKQSVGLGSNRRKLVVFDLDKLGLLLVLK